LDPFKPTPHTNIEFIYLFILINFIRNEVKTKKEKHNENIKKKEIEDNDSQNGKRERDERTQARYFPKLYTRYIKI